MSGSGGSRRSTAATAGTGVSGTGQSDVGWQHCVQVEANNKRKVRCLYCDRIIYAGVTRLKEHLGGITGEVAACQKVPKDVKIEMRDLMLNAKRDKVEAKKGKQRAQKELMHDPRDVYDVTSESEPEDEGDRNPNEVAFRRDMRRAARESREMYYGREEGRRFSSAAAVGEGSGSGRATLPRSFTTGRERERSGRDYHQPAVGPVDPVLREKQGKHQPNIKSALKGLANIKRKMGRAVSKFFIFNHIPFNAANSPYYESMVREIQEADVGVAPPTAREIAGTYLDEEVEETKAWVKTFHRYWDEYGCTLMTDGWSTDNRRSIINFLAYCPIGTVFLRSVDATTEKKTAQYIANLIMKVIDEDICGTHRVVHICTDNGANYKAAGRLVMKERPTIFWSPCAAHSIDLMLEDMAQEPEFSPLIARCQRLTGFIYNHGWALQMMREELGRELVRPAITRFATHFLALDSILRHKEGLRKMFRSDAWYAQLADGLDKKTKKRAEQCAALMYNESFWSEIEDLVVVFEPLVKVLRLVDSDDKAEMGYLYEAMDRAKEAIRSGLRSRKRSSKKWFKIIDKRWDKTLHRPLHAAGYFLNPEFQYSGKVNNDLEVMQGIRTVIQSIEPDVDRQMAALREMERFRMRLGEFGSSIAQLAINKNLSPAEWWSIYGRQEAPHLAPIAVKVLSQTVSSSGCERNWVTFSLIHTKTRNRLGMEKLEKLVYCHYNMRLRVRTLRRQQEIDVLINLDDIFESDDPLSEWLREREQPLLDGQRNTWLDAFADEMEVPLEFESMVAETQPRKRKGKEVPLSSSGSAASGSSSGPGGAGDAEQEHGRPGGDGDSSLERSPVSPGAFHDDDVHSDPRMTSGRGDIGAASGSGTSHPDPTDSLAGSSGYEPHDYYGYTGYGGYPTEYGEAGEQYYTTADDVTSALDGMLLFGLPSGAWQPSRRDDDDDQPADASSSWYFG